MVEAALGPVIIGILIGGIVIVNLPKEPFLYDPSKSDFEQVQFETAKSLSKKDDGKSKKIDGKSGSLPKPVSMKEIDAAHLKNLDDKAKSGKKETTPVKPTVSIDVEEDKRLTDEVIEMI